MQYPPISSRLLLCFLSALVVALASFLSIVNGVPAWHSPLSLTIVMTYIFIGEFFQVPELAFTVPAIIFLVINYHLFIPSTSNVLPRRNFVVLILMTAISVSWHIASYDAAIKWEGLQFYLSMIAINILAISILGWTCYRLRHQATWMQSCLASTGIFFWIFWSAVPYFGELM